VSVDLGLSEEELGLLNAHFPPKTWLPTAFQSADVRAQEADRRARAFDAYLQLLLRSLSRDTKGHEIRRRWSHPKVVTFFRIPFTPPIRSPQETCAMSRLLKTPTGFEDLLRRAEVALSRRAYDEVRELLGLMSGDVPGSKDLSRRFYDVKREYETAMIKSGQVDDDLRDSFRIEKPSKTGQRLQSQSQSQSHSHSHSESLAPLPSPQTTMASPLAQTANSAVLQSQRQNLKYQDAILTDLASTLKEQRELSEGVAREVSEQNRELGRLREHGESTGSAFAASAKQIQKLK
jgi:hypothetical protein